MKRAFTMIELIFAIVILGILSAIAIPKLNATRDDAALVRAQTDLVTAIKDIQSYYTIHAFVATASSNLQDMTNVKLYNDADGNPARPIGGAWMAVGSQKNCIMLEVNRSQSTTIPYLGVKLNKDANELCERFANHMNELGLLGIGYTNLSFNATTTKLEKDKWLIYKLSGDGVKF